MVVQHLAFVFCKLLKVVGLTRFLVFLHNNSSQERKTGIRVYQSRVFVCLNVWNFLNRTQSMVVSTMELPVRSICTDDLFLKN